MCKFSRWCQSSTLLHKTLSSLCIVTAFVLVSSIVLIRVYNHRKWKKELFMGQILSAFYNISCYSEWLACETDQPIEDVEDYYTNLLVEITKAKAVLDAGHAYVSSEIPESDPFRGLGMVDTAIRGRLGSGYQTEAFPVDGISESERLFLQELSVAVNKLWKPYKSYLERTTSSCSIQDFLREYSTFEEKWQVDGWRTSSGASPFDCLKVPA